MAVGINASGFIGIAFETTPGTYTAPTKFVPITSENLKYEQNTTWRRPIRQTPDVVGPVAGDSFINGDINMEALHDTVPYFIHASRNTFVKSGAGPYTYTYTPSAAAIPTTGRTLSITVVRNGIVFGYTGCIVSKFKFTIDNGMLMFMPSIVGASEAVQSLPTATWGTTTPIGAGNYNLQIPTATQVFDADKFEFTVDDNGVPQYRLKSTGTGAQFANWGERSVSLSVTRDFQDRTDYDAFKALTSQGVQLTATNGTYSFAISAATAIKDTYEVDLNNQGDLVRADIVYQMTLGSGNAYSLVIITSESIT